MSTTQSNSGFTLPQPGGESAPPAGAAYTSTVPSETTLPMSTDTSARNFTLGLVSIVVLAVVLLFVRKAWANNLVARRVPPRKANQAGWCLYACLLFGMGGGALIAFNEPFQTLFNLSFVLIPTGFFLALTIAASRK